MMLFVRRLSRSFIILVSGDSYTYFCECVWVLCFYNLSPIVTFYESILYYCIPLQQSNSKIPCIGSKNMAGTNFCEPVNWHVCPPPLFGIMNYRTVTDVGQIGGLCVVIFLHTAKEHGGCVNFLSASGFTAINSDVIVTCKLWWGEVVKISAWSKWNMSGDSKQAKFKTG